MARHKGTENDTDARTCEHAHIDVYVFLGGVRLERKINFSPRSSPSEKKAELFSFPRSHARVPGNRIEH